MTLVRGPGQADSTESPVGLFTVSPVGFWGGGRGGSGSDYMRLYIPFAFPRSAHVSAIIVPLSDAPATCS